MKAEHFDGLQFGMSDHAATSARFAEKLEQVNSAAMARDAARYRWLRHGDHDEQVLCNGPVDMSYWYLLRNEKLDAAIDAAIAAQDVEFVKPGAAFSFEAETK